MRPAHEGGGLAWKAREEVGWGEVEGVGLGGLTPILTLRQAQGRLLPRRGGRDT